jgi:hypothetical protein
MPVVFMMEHVYYTGKILSRLRVLRSSWESVLAAFTWSPNYALMSAWSKVHFHWVPFAANFHKFGDLKRKVEAQTKKPLVYRYDIGFTGVCTKLGYYSRWQIAEHWKDMYEAGIILTPNLRPNRFQAYTEHYSVDKYKELIAESKMWLATTGWHEYVGIRERNKTQWFTRKGASTIFPDGVDLVGTRFFEVMSSGTTLVLCDRRSVYTRARLFEDKRHVVMFDGYQDMMEKVMYYRAHEAERMAIVKRAALLIHKWHTYKQRANLVVSVTWAALQKKCSKTKEVRDESKSCKALRNPGVNMETQHHLHLERDFWRPPGT